MRRLVIAGNWKMNADKKFVTDLITAIKARASGFKNIDTVLIPPSLYVAQAVQLTKDSEIKIGVQNIHQEAKGAFTGEISTEMAKDSEAKYVLIGHSERRQYFGETDQLVALKVSSVIKNGLTPIVCIGEKLEERESGNLEKVIKKQLTDGLYHLTPEQFSNVIIAYEPVWAIGTGKTATPQQAQEVHAFIRKELGIKFGSYAEKTIIQYGGSVNDSNAVELLSQSDIDGALIGGASLKADAFLVILETANKL